MRLTVIGTFHGRLDNTLPLLKRLYVDSTRKPDEAFLMCEDTDDLDAFQDAYEELYDLELLESLPDGMEVRLCPTPRTDGAYDVLPYAHKINKALDECTGDAIVYLDNNSDPAPEKYATMLNALETHEAWGAVYCTQKRTGWNETVAIADGIVYDGFCVTNYTQVMHRKTHDRWPLDMSLGDPDLADAVFWRKLHASIGPFHPVGDERPLDTHHMEHTYAAGLHA